MTFIHLYKMNLNILITEIFSVFQMNYLLSKNHAEIMDTFKTGISMISFLFLTRVKEVNSTLTKKQTLLILFIKRNPVYVL